LDSKAIEGLQQLPWPQQKLGVGGSSEAFVPHHERFVNEHATWGKRGTQCVKQRAMQVIGHYDRLKLLAWQRPRVAVLEIRLHKARSWYVLRLAVDGCDLQLSFNEKPAVPPIAASNV
jgi:hypothetical protein